MSRLSVWFGVLFLSALLLCSSAAAYNVTGSSVVDTNVYAGSSVSFISPVDTYDPLSCTAAGMTSDSNVYVRPIGFSASVSNSVDVLLSTGVQGAQITLDDGAVVQTPFVWDFGIGSATETFVPHTLYTYPSGEYTAKVTVSNYLDSGGESASVPISILYGGYDSYAGGFSSVLSLIVVAALVAAVALLLLYLRFGGDIGLLVPFSVGVMILIVVLMVIVNIAGTMDNITMGLFSGGI